MVIDEPPDTFLERGASKIDQEPYGLSHQAQISQQLFRVRAMELLDGFDFDQQSAVDEQIDSEGALEFHAIEFDIHRC